MRKKEKLWISFMKFGNKMGCHQLPERSFFWHGYQFPVCARCTGVFLSFPVAIWLVQKNKCSIKMACLLSEIMLIDWSLQFLQIKESNNTRRLITGCLGGLGVHTLYFRTMKFIIKKIASLFDEKNMNKHSEQNVRLAPTNETE